MCLLDTRIHTRICLKRINKSKMTYLTYFCDIKLYNMVTNSSVKGYELIVDVFN